jgi:hypothetical protein
LLSVAEWGRAGGSFACALSRLICSLLSFYDTPDSLRHLFFALRHRPTYGCGSCRLARTSALSSDLSMSPTSNGARNGSTRVEWALVGRLFLLHSHSHSFLTGGFREDGGGYCVRKKMIWGFRLWSFSFVSFFFFLAGFFLEWALNLPVVYTTPCVCTRVLSYG